MSMTKTTRCLLCVALICAIALLLPAVRAQAEGENPTYAYDSATKTLTITPGTSGLIGKEIQNESDYYSKWTKEVEKVIIAGDIRGIGTIGEDHNLVDGVFLTWRKLKEVEYQGKPNFMWEITPFMPVASWRLSHSNGLSISAMAP